MAILYQQYLGLGVINNILKFMGRFVFGFLMTAGTIIALQFVYYNYIDTYRLPEVQQPIEILNENKEIAVGETILMRIIVEKFEEAETNIDPSITCDDDNLITLKTGASTLPVGSFNVVQDRYTLPPKVEVGSVCEFNFVGTYRINPYVSKVETWTSEQFKVVER